uniref:Rhamnolipids biosynthesis 3-oxoacyl-[acyl-carrier-protein] reductase n=1 Tax=Anthurium amnicola TaxID=1678845 RepID=A0A1D1YSA1_9ARAE
MAENLSAQNLFSLKGKVALVTGGGTGLGRMISKVFVKNGAKVYIASRNQKNLEEATTELNSLGGSGECIPIVADITIKEECEKIANKISKKENGKLDILINNSGFVWGAPLTEIPEEAWDKVFRLNVISVYFMTMACLPLLEKASNVPEDPSKVIIIGSISGIYEGDLNGIGRVDRTSMVYNTSKAAVHSLARNLAVYLTPCGVNVNVIAPGVIPTPMNRNHLNKELATADVPQGRLGNEADVAGTALYLASRAGAWTSGSIVKIDGGTLLRGRELGRAYAIAAKSKL